MIKEMRDVEQRLGKPDPSEDTQKKQKQIVKRIETMIEQAKQSGSSAGRTRRPAGSASRASSRVNSLVIKPAHWLAARPR